ncbi:MAG: DUF4112 domain-containing protein [Phycisphaerales bacterium]|nr:DUF4112 domain-containing protein [Phycisphaerales bacterium]
MSAFPAIPMTSPADHHSATTGPATPPTSPPHARRLPHARSELDRATRIERLRKLAVLMDSSIRIPGLKFRIGLDPLIGLLPGVGDLITTSISAYIIYQGYKLGADRVTILKMIGNALIDGLLGEIPIAGDIFDFAFKANLRNLRLLGIDAKGVQIEIDPAAPFRESARSPS